MEEREMIPMKCRQKISAALAVILLMLPFMIVFASASSYADFEREVSLEITDIPFANMKFYAYFVAEFDKNGKLCDGLEETFRFNEENGNTRNKVQETVLCRNGFVSTWRNVRPIPQNVDFFENVWKQYRENKNIF